MSLSLFRSTLRAAIRDALEVAAAPAPRHASDTGIPAASTQVVAPSRPAWPAATSGSSTLCGGLDLREQAP